MERIAMKKYLAIIAPIAKQCAAATPNFGISRAPPNIRKQQNWVDRRAFNQFARDWVIVMFSVEDCIMKKLLAIVVGSLALVVGQPLIIQHWSEATAQEGIPLPAGHFSDTRQSSMAVCVNPTIIAQEPCSTSGAAVLAESAVDNGSATADSAGNACGTITEVDSFLLLAASSSISPSIVALINTSPSFVITNIHPVSKLVDFDSTTGIGHRSVTVYIGGTCSGASFDSSNATKVNSVNQQFVVSNGGNRIDFIATSFLNQLYGSFTDSGTELKQTTQNNP